MVSLFPQLFDYGFLATAVLRITIGLILIHLAYLSFFVQRNDRLISIKKAGIKQAFLFLSIENTLKVTLGVLLVIGLFTQVATLAVSAFAFATFFINKQKSSLLILSNTNEFYLLLFVVSLVLAFIGPGAFAFDLPL